MNTKLVLAAVVVGLSAGQAVAETEGNGDPFPLQAAGLSMSGRAFVTEAGADAYPQLTGEATQPSSLAQLEPASGQEAPVQTAGSLPRGFGNGSVASAQAQNVTRYWAAQDQKRRYLEAGTVRPRS